MAEIIIHIGLPKTATTSLQIDLFPKLDKNTIQYLGIYQPRSEVQKDLFRKIYHSTETGENVNEIKTLIRAELKNNKDLILSDEMFTVGDWEKKLENLYQLVNEFNPKIIVTVREPISAMFSYYCELYNSFKDHGSFSNAVLNDNRMKIFYYNYFFNFIIYKLGFNDITILKFENIIKGDLTSLNKLLKLSESKEIKNYNSKKNIQNIVIKKESLNLSKLIVIFFQKIGIYNFIKRIFKNEFRGEMRKIFDKKITVKTHNIAKPSKDEIEHLHSILKNELTFTHSNIDIDYYNYNNN